MALTVFIALSGAAFCIYRNSPSPLGRYDLLLAISATAAVAATAYAGWPLAAQVLLAALFATSMWYLSTRAEQRYRRQHRLAPRFESVPMTASITALDTNAFPVQPIQPSMPPRIPLARQLGVKPTRTHSTLEARQRTRFTLTEAEAVGHWQRRF